MEEIANLEFMLDNVERLRRGETLEGIVNKQAGF